MARRNIQVALDVGNQICLWIIGDRVQCGCESAYSIEKLKKMKYSDLVDGKPVSSYFTKKEFDTAKKAIVYFKKAMDKFNTRR